MKTANHFADRHAQEHFNKLKADHKAKVRMPLAEARALLINHPRHDDGDAVYETVVKALGAGVYEVSLSATRDLPARLSSSGRAVSG